MAGGARRDLLDGVVEADWKRRALNAADERAPATCCALQRSGELLNFTMNVSIIARRLRATLSSAVSATGTP